MGDSALQVRFTKTLQPKEHLTLGKMYDVLSMVEIGSINIAGIDTPESMEFIVENDAGDTSTLRLCNVDVYVGGELLD